MTPTSSTPILSQIIRKIIQFLTAPSARFIPPNVNFPPKRYAIKAATPLAALILLASHNHAKAASVDDLQYSVKNGQVSIIGCAVTATGALEIPSSIEGLPVTRIGKWAFSGVPISAVTVPGSVLYVSPSAFTQCPELTSLTVQPGVQALGEESFYICPKLASVSLPDGMTYLGERVFGKCTALQEITLPKDIKTISEGAFQLSALRRVAMLGALDIGESAFSSCFQLSSVQLSPNLESIQANAFKYCPLKSLEFPETLYYIGPSALKPWQGKATLKSLYFLGDAPNVYSGPFNFSEYNKLTVYYKYGRAGFTSSRWVGVRLDYIRPILRYELPGGTQLVDEVSINRFGIQKLGTSSAWKSVQVRNSGNYRCDLIRARLDGLNKGDFFVEYFPQTTLAPGASMFVKVKFKPKASGIRTANLHIENSLGAGNTFDLGLTGNGKK